MWHSLTVSDIRLVGRSEDGSILLLQTSEGASHRLEIDEKLKALINQPRLVAVSDTSEQASVSVKEIQARLRSGESIDSIARSCEWAPEKIEKFSGPILQERAYVIALALAATLRKEKHAPTLAAATISLLAPRGVDMALIEWNTWRLPDGMWNIILFYPAKDGTTNEANWTFNLSNRSLEAIDDGAAWISGDEIEVHPPTPSHGIVYPSATPPPRLVAVRETSVSAELTDVDMRDGVTQRLKIPSWDDIMFSETKGISEEE